MLISAGLYLHEANSSVRVMNVIEQQRQSLQAHLDNKRSVEYRRRLGQFATPFSLSEEIASYGLSLHNNEQISFLEPAIGTGSFYSALLSCAGAERIESAKGFEIDEEIGAATRDLWGSGIDILIEDLELFGLCM